MLTINKCLQTRILQEDMLQHTKVMNETMVQIQAVGSGLTEHTGGYKLSKSRPHRTRSVQTGPSYVQQARIPQVQEDD